MDNISLESATIKLYTINLKLITRMHIVILISLCTKDNKNLDRMPCVLVSTCEGMFQSHVSDAL